MLDHFEAFAFQTRVGKVEMEPVWHGLAAWLLAMLVVFLLF